MLDVSTREHPKRHQRGGRRCLIPPACFSPIFPTVHIKEHSRYRTRHTARDGRVLPGQPRLFQITQLFHASPLIHSQVRTPRRPGHGGRDPLRPGPARPGTARPPFWPADVI